MKIYRLKLVYRSGVRRYPAIHADSPREAIASALKMFPRAISGSVVAELSSVTDDWDVNYEEITNVEE